MYNPPPPPNISPTVYERPTSPPPEKKGLCHNVNPGLNYGILRYQTCFKSYHAYTTKWNPKFGQFLKTWLEPENEFYKFAVAAEKCDVVDGHLSKRKTSRFAKTISFLLCKSNESPCKVEVTGKRVNLADGERLEIPCKLYFTGDSNYIDNLKNILSTLLQIYIFYSIFFHFLITNGQKFELTSIFLP